MDIKYATMENLAAIAAVEAECFLLNLSPIYRVFLTSDNFLTTFYFSANILLIFEVVFCILLFRICV